MHTQEQIEAYIAGKLTGEELQQFEKQLQTDTALAEEVEIHRGMQDYLQSGPKADLLANLEEISGNYEEDDGKGGALWRRWLPFLVAGLIGMGIIWKISVQSEISPNQESEVSLDTEVEQNVPSNDNLKGVLDTTNQIEEQEIEAENKEENSTNEVINEQDKTDEKLEKKTDILLENEENKKPPFIDDTPPKPSKPIASNYTPNPRLEEFASSQLRSSGIIEANLVAVSVASPSDPPLEYPIIFNANLTIEEHLKDLPFRVLVFDNKIKSYEDFAPLTTVPVNVAPDGAYYQLQFDILELSPGLYYYYLEDELEGTVYYVLPWKVEEE